MALGTFIYLRHVNNLSDARYAAGMGVDLIGFNFDPKDSAVVDFDKFKEISEWISGVKIVGEFGKSPADEVREKLEKVAPDYLLISDESQIREFAGLGIPLILRLDLDAPKEAVESTLNHCAGSADYFLLESKEAIRPKTEMIREFGINYPILLGSGITVENADNITKELNLQGISLSGGDEIRPGYRDFDELADILEALETD